jgi:hypothetical protein
MNAPNDNTTPSRTGMRRVFPPWEFRHLRAWAGARIAGGIVLVGLGALMLPTVPTGGQRSGWCWRRLRSLAAIGN